MPDEQPLEEGTVIQLTRIANPNRPTFYANHSLINGNQWDLQICFSLIQEIAPGQIGAVDQAVVIMTPEHALALSKVLQRVVEGFQQRQGPIRVVEAIQPPVNPKI